MGKFMVVFGILFSLNAEAANCPDFNGTFKVPGNTVVFTQTGCQTVKMKYANDVSGSTFTADGVIKKDCDTDQMICYSYSLMLADKFHFLFGVENKNDPKKLYVNTFLSLNPAGAILAKKIFTDETGIFANFTEVWKRLE